MTTYTVSQLATRMLKDLGLYGSDETPSAEDLDWATETVNSELLMLNVLGIPIWNGSAVSIPQEYLTILSRRLGLAVAPSFGLADLASAQLAMREAERYLTMLAAPTVVKPRPLRTDDALPRTAFFNYTTGQ